MNWTYGIKNKFLASVILLALCLLVLLSHYLDSIHTQNVKNSITTMYEDRLIAEGFILKMTSNIYQIREILNADLDTISKSKVLSKIIEDFDDSYNNYMRTKLTETEKVTAIDLFGDIEGLKNNLLSNHAALLNFTERALSSLNKLSDVQLEESKLIMKNTESTYAAIKTSSQFAFGIVIIILLVLQAMVFSAKTLIPIKKPRDPTLN